MTGFVYAIASGHDRVKLGFSTSPLLRLVKLQSDNGHPCDLLGVVRATPAQEAELHSLLAPWRERGEWFRREGPVETVISMLRPFSRFAKSKRPGRTRLEAWLRETDIRPIEFAREIGVSPSIVTRLLNGSRGASLDLALKIEEHTRGQVRPSDLLRDTAREAAA